MKSHSFKFVLALAGLATLALLLFGAWHFAVPLIRDYHNSAQAEKPRFTDPNNPKQILAEADRLAWVFNSQAAAPLYSRAEQLFAKSGLTQRKSLILQCVDSHLMLQRTMAKMPYITRYVT